MSCRSSWWKLNSRATPAPCWGPPFVWPDRWRSDWREMSGNPPSTLRFLGAVKRFVPSIQIRWSFPCSAPHRLFVRLSFSSPRAQERYSVRLTSGVQFGFLGAHHKPWCPPGLEVALSSQIRRKTTVPANYFGKRLETGKQVRGKTHKGGGMEEGSGMKWVGKRGWPQFKRHWVKGSKRGGREEGLGDLKTGGWTPLVEVRVCSRLVERSFVFATSNFNVGAGFFLLLLFFFLDM